MVTRFTIALDAGGELQVVRQNLETTSAEAAGERGRQVLIGWRDDQTAAISSTKEEE
jgi:putative spermidine/putrescine transport system ATP-binding protein